MTPSTAPCHSVTGYVLAGGRSSRMGQDKALLEHDGAPLVEHVLRRLRPLCAGVAILSGPPDPGRDALLASYARLVSDSATGHDGPLAGLAAALRDCSTEFALLLGVDQPGIGGEVLEAFVLRGSVAEAAAACLLHDGRPEPLPLLVSRDLHPAIQQALRDGERRLLPTVRACALRAQRPLHLVAPPAAAGQDVFLNLNTPDDLLRWQKSNHSAAGASEQGNG